jgi:hypothetical protein
MAAGDLHGVIVAQAADQLGYQGRVAGGAAGQVGQGLVGRGAERLDEHVRHHVLVQRGQHEPGGTVLDQQAEQVVRGPLGGA